MSKKIPKTREECFAQLDAMLSDEDKKVLMEADDSFDFHFTLGLWIRNNWLYPLSDEELKSFMRLFSDECESPFGYITIHPDHMSSVIIEKYAASLHSKAATSS